jgi:hypothetical protein
MFQNPNQGDYKRYILGLSKAIIFCDEPIIDAGYSMHAWFYFGECLMFQKYWWWANQMAPSWGQKKRRE